ncbi:gamma-glutamyltransferase [Salinimonas marina]|uniref:Glutathione hydrolase proenzyme n=1 Tax=Salinimonas marina TaxID=2785918 RepID=A0A7S9DX70_9ALTE|nr:gamma-glutamyltransferase [Salinimonas marina]QPG05358.1 gamma-glutamyltransferase [Salinimonas marina]
MRHLLWIIVFVVVSGCAQQPDTSSSPGNAQAVAAPDTFSANAAMAVLQDGGNAVDAAIATQFVLAVTLPEAGNIGGGGFMTLVHEGETDFLDFREMAPGKASRDMYLDDNGKVKPHDSLYGVRASGVPGSVAGMWAAHQKYGSLPWRRLVQPAVDLAEQGFVVPEKLAGNINQFIQKSREKNLINNFTAYFGHATAGSTLVQPELAATLKRIRDEGKAGFYEGETARMLADFMQQHDGLITEDDLSRYQAIWREPVTFRWQGYTLVTAPPPSSGGIAVAQWLGMFAQAQQDMEPADHNSVKYIHLLSEIGKRVFADRAKYLGDPDFIDVPMAALIDDDYIARRAGEVNPDTISDSDSIEPGLTESEQTTHFSIVDQWGNAVAITTTLNLGFGSGMVVTDAGFLLNDEMDDFSAKAGVPNFFGAVGGKANEIQPYKRMLSSMSPTVVLDAEQDVALVTGSPGGTTIISSVTQSVLNALHFDMSAEQAVNAPRFHHQLWPENTIRMHTGIATDKQQQLKQLGYTLKQQPFGDLQLIKRTSQGLEAASQRSGRGLSLVEEAAQ